MGAVQPLLQMAEEGLDATIPPSLWHIYLELIAAAVRIGLEDEFFLCLEDSVDPIADSATVALALISIAAALREHDRPEAMVQASAEWVLLQILRLLDGSGIAAVGALELAYAQQCFAEVLSQRSWKSPPSAIGRPQGGRIN